MVDPPKKTGTTTAGTDTFGPSGAGVWSTPTVDAARGVLYVTTGDNYSEPATATSDAIMALDLKTGRILWSQQTTSGRRLELILWRPRARIVHSRAAPITISVPRQCWCARRMDGTFSWQDKNPASCTRSIHRRRENFFGRRELGKAATNGGVQWGMASDGRNVYASVSDVVRLSGSINGPAPIGNVQLDPVKGGGLTALNLLDGSKVWFAREHPLQSSASRLQPGSTRCGHGNTGRSVFRLNGRAHPRILIRGWRAALGFRYREKFPDGKRSSGKRRFARWRRSGHRGRNDLREFGLSPIWRKPGKRDPRLRVA